MAKELELVGISKGDRIVIEYCERHGLSFKDLTPLQIIEAADEHFNPSHIFACFSGGHDSLVATHIASRYKKFDGVVHINTGIGIEETREFVRGTCREHGWKLYELKAEEGIYEKRCLKYGMPSGSFEHGKMYGYLKARPLRSFIKSTRIRKESGYCPILFITGVRATESMRRMRIHSNYIEMGEYTSNWVNPILWWTGCDIGRYIEKHGLKRNKVVDLLHRSGECLCGALARPDEIKEIELWYPEVAKRIHDLEEECRKRGLPYKWGARKVVDNIDNNNVNNLPEQFSLPLCTKCVGE